MKDKKINQSIIISITAFLLYFVLGMLLSYYNEVDNSMYFGSDNSRAYVDLMLVKDVELNHYRITVHPLMLILLQPVTSLMTGIFHDARMGLIVLQAILGAGCVRAVYMILEKLCENKIFVYFLSAIYMFSFSNVIFSTVPETFIFSGFIITNFWLYIFEQSSSQKKMDKADYLILVFFGVFNFGITLTNYISYFIGVFYLVYKKSGTFNRKFVLDLTGIHILNLDLLLVLATVQQKIWESSPTFIEGVCDALFTKSQFEEFNYMNMEVGTGKLRELCVQVFCLPILSADVDQIQVNEVYTPILFQQYADWQKVLLSIYYIVFIAVVVMYFAKKKKNKISEAVVVLVTFLFNFTLHYFYGYHEAFMYSPHYLFLVFVFWGIALNGIKSKCVRNILSFILVAFSGIELVSNYKTFIKVTQHIQVFYGNYYYHAPLMMKSLCIGIVLVCMGSVCNLAKVHIASALKLEGKTIFAASIIMYVMLVLISCIGIRVNYWRI